MISWRERADTNPVDIRLGNAGDVADLRWAWARESQSGSTATAQPTPIFVAEVAEWMSSNSRTIWSAYVGGQAVGMVCLTHFQRMPSPAAEAAGAWGYLGHLYVVPDARGGGIGSGLVATLLVEAKVRNYSKVLLSPTELSIPVYRRAGFDAGHKMLMWWPR